MAPDANEEKAQGRANEDTAHKEACNYWGYLIQKDKCGTDKFNRLLEGIADVISKKFNTNPNCPDLTPQQLAAFYRSVGGDYDVLFGKTPSSSISFIYRSLGAFHSLQPAADDDGYSAPTVPALKKKGFVTWQTIQLLLGPEEHVAFLQEAVKKFDIKDSQTGELFIKVLPKECLPQEPDEAMEAWYETVAARLKREAEEDAASKGEQNGPRVHVNIDEHAPRTSSEMSDSEAADERHAAATYFADPLYRQRNRRPPIMRHFSKDAREARRFEEEKENRGRLMNSVRHMFNPFTREREKDRRKSHPASGRYNDGYSDDDEDNDITPMASQPPPVPRYTHTHPYPVSHKRPHPPRRESSLSSTDSDSDSDDRPSSRRRTPAPGVHRRRSHDPPSAQRDYFSTYYDDRDRRYSHDVPGSSFDNGGGGIPLHHSASTGHSPSSRKEDGPLPHPHPHPHPQPPLYGPTKGPIFATHVAHMQPHIPHHHPHHPYYTNPPSSSSSSTQPHQQPISPNHRPQMPTGGAPLRASYRASPPKSAPSVRYSTAAAPPPSSVPPPPPHPPPPPAPAPPVIDVHEPVYVRDRDRPRDRDYLREYPRRDLSPYSPLSGNGNTRHHNSSTSQNAHHVRRRSEDLLMRDRERDREWEGGRTARSHERSRDEWDDERFDERERDGRRRARGGDDSREASLSRSRSDRGRNGGNGGAGPRLRGGGGGVDGVGGRRYPVDAPWR